MENKAKIGFLILLIFYIILAESEMWGPVIITGDTPAEAILKLSNTPAAVSAESVLVKRYDSTISSYPINNIKTTKIQWDSVTSKPTAYNPVLHQHDSIYYRETEVNNLLSSKSDTSHTHPQSKINGLVDTITNHRNAIASKFATADTNKLARKSHNHNISDVNNLSTELSNRYTKTELQTSGFSQVHWGNITNKPSTFTPSAHTLVSHSDWSTYFDQALKTTSTPTFAKINISNGGLINDWVHLGATHNPSSPYEKRWYKAYELTGTGRGDEDIELRVHGDVNYYNGACIVRLKITRYDGEPANQLHVTITPISGWPSNALVKVDGGIVWVASNFKWGDIYGRLVQSRYNPGRVLFNTAYTQTEPAGVSINGTFGVKTYDGDTQNVVLHDVEGANGYFTGNVTVNGYGVWHSGNFDPSTKANATHGHAWGEITDKPSTFAPSAHVHAIADVTSLQTALDSKQPLDSDLTAIAGLTHSNRHVMVSNGSSWTRRALEEADLPSLSSAKLPSNVVYTDNAQTITGVKTFSSNTTFGNNIITSKSLMAITPNTSDGADTKGIILGYESTTRGAGVGVYGNESGQGGDLIIQAGTGNGTRAGAIRINSPLMYFGTRPANDHWWNLALDRYNTLYGTDIGTNIMHNLYYDGADWRYRYGSGSNSGGVLTTLAYNQFSVSVADNGTADSIATLTPAIHTNLSGNTAFGKSTFVGGYRLEVEGNTLVNGTLTVNIIPAKTTAASVYLTHENNTIKTRTAAQVRADIGAAAANHTQAISTITNLQDTLNNKQPLDSDLTAIAGLIHSNRHVLISDGSTWTRRALAEDDLPSLSISKITGLQTALDSKEPAITGIANKVLSIQAGGSGVKTGSIYDDGNVVQFEKAFIGNSSSTGIRHYHDLYLYNNLNSTDTGILKIVMPQGWTNTFQRITIKGYNYISGQGAWECIIGGYNYNATNDANDQWVNYSAQIRGSAPFSTVRLGYDGSKCVLLLGTTETVWSYAKVAISDMLVGGVGSAIYNWETGWSASIITSETGLTKIVAPTVNSGVGADWNALINKPSYFAPSAHTHPWSEVTGKPSTFAPSAHSHPWSEITGKPSTFTPSAHNHGTGTTNYIPLFTNGATGTIGNSQLSQNTDGVIASKGITANDFLQSMGPLYTRSHVYLINKAGTGWLSFVTRDVSGSEAKFNLANIGSIDGVGPITLSDGVGGYFQLYNNSGQGRAMLKTNNKMYFTVETSTLPAADAITIDRDAGSLGDGIPKVDINAVTLMNEDLHIQGDVNVNSLVRLSGAVRYDYIQHVGSVPTIDTDNYPGIYLIPSNPHNYTLTGGAPEQRIFVGNRSTHVQQVEGYRIEPGQFRDFLKTGTGWIASGASISGKTISVSHGTGNISVSNVSTVHINYTPTSTYTLTDGYVGQRVTVVVLSGSAQHWIHGATKGHKIVEGEFRDFIYTTDGWVASAADY